MLENTPFHWSINKKTYWTGQKLAVKNNPLQTHPNFQDDPDMFQGQFFDQSYQPWVFNDVHVVLPRNLRIYTHLHQNLAQSQEGTGRQTALVSKLEMECVHIDWRCFHQNADPWWAGTCWSHRFNIHMSHTLYMRIFVGLQHHTLCDSREIGRCETFCRFVGLAPRNLTVHLRKICGLPVIVLSFASFFPVHYDWGIFNGMLLRPGGPKKQI